jgi:hypothetical protein
MLVDRVYPPLDMVVPADERQIELTETYDEKKSEKGNAF